MMRGIYSSPLRVYLCFAILAISGIFASLQLPVSLFPNSTKPSVFVRIPYGRITADEFQKSFGRYLEEELRAIQEDDIDVEKVEAEYTGSEAQYDLEFAWGNSPTSTLQEVQNTVNRFASRLPSEMRDEMRIHSRNRNSGFFALSFFSDIRDTNELFRIIDPVLGPRIATVKDAQDPVLWNPTEKEIRIELNPQAMANLQIYPKDVERAINEGMASRQGGSVRLGAQQLQLDVPASVDSIETLGTVQIATPSGFSVPLNEIATINYRNKEDQTRIIKTSGAESLILFSVPKPGGNVKKMSEDILAEALEVLPTLPKDIKYRVLVDPSEFIRSAIENVFFEVGLAALLAVAVLLVFIGSLRNTITAAIEIPISMVLAFILMKFSGMNLNLISLGGLALSAGMNVDASVVVMENIFRHFDELRASGKKIDVATRLKTIVAAVNEVRLPIIAATIASLVVFIPLAFTSELTNAVLGDLAKTVVFSHGFSAFVALILVPTIRLQMMNRAAKKGGDERPFRSFIHRPLKAIENFYIWSLRAYLKQGLLRFIVILALLASAFVLVSKTLPSLPKEIIGKPDTDWLTMNIEADEMTEIRQMESQVDQIEAQILERFGEKIRYTFVQVYQVNAGFVMARLKDKSEIKQLREQLEEVFQNTPFLRFHIGQWNPSELPIPDPPQLEVSIRAGTPESRQSVAQRLKDAIQEQDLFTNIWADPEVSRKEAIRMRPNFDRWPFLRQMNLPFDLSDLTDLTTIATSSRKVGEISVENQMTDIRLSYPPDQVSTLSDIQSFPIRIKDKVVPLKALVEIGREVVPPVVQNIDGKPVVYIQGRLKQKELENKDEIQKKAADIVQNFKITEEPAPLIQLEDSEKDLTTALEQLTWAIGVSVILIFLTLVMQFGNFTQPFLVMAAVPLGMMGVIGSLYFFESTISLNSVLGTILLNGIAVANSILLVDFLTRRYRDGLSPTEAALDSGRKRFRPILMTSLTTILGMAPIALGHGEGGKILQPLGIAVSGGLWFSTLLTLYVVPGLQVSYLNFRDRRQKTIRKRVVVPPPPPQALRQGEKRVYQKQKSRVEK